MGCGTMRSVAESSFGMGLINKRLEGTNRMNTFLGSVKDQLKMQSKAQVQPKQAPSGTQQLAIVAKKFYLPAEIQF
jgi:hypothetical protein